MPNLSKHLGAAVECFPPCRHRLQARGAVCEQVTRRRMQQRAEGVS